MNFPSADRSQILIGAIALSALIVTLAYFKEDGLDDLSRANGARAQLEAKIDALKLAESAARERLYRIKSDRLYVESLARERLGLVKPGEIVYEFIDEDRLPRAERIEEPTPKER